MNWNKDISIRSIIAAGIALGAIAAMLGYAAAGKHLGITNDTDVHVRDISPAADQVRKNKICIQVITRARDPLTHETKEFPTPCDVPASWEILK